MANYYATARSNYFRVKDSITFESWVESRQTLGTFKKDVGGETLYAIYDDGGDANGWPLYDVETDEPIDLAAELAEHLVDGEVAVLFEVGAEKLRYVLGSAVAVRSDGKVLQLHLNEIYQMIFEEWGVTTNAAEY